MACAEQLAGVYTDIFNLSLIQAVAPRFSSPKRPDPFTHNDYRPVALTPVVMNCLEKVVLTHITSVISDSTDPLQFAYCPNRLVGDAVIRAPHDMLQNLDCSRTYTWMLFLDDSSAFNNSSREADCEAQ